MLRDYPITQHPGASRKYFPLLSAMTKGIKVLLGDCCHRCSPISNNLWQSHKCVQKHCLKKCQFASLAHSSACFQIHGSSVSSSRDQFDRQILLIPKCVISLCEHLPFYLEWWLEFDPDINRNVNINLPKLFISENWERQTCLLIYTLSHPIQMLEPLTVPNVMYTCHSWKWQVWDDPQFHFVGLGVEKYECSRLDLETVCAAYRKGKSLQVMALSDRHGQWKRDWKNTIWTTRDYLRRGYN